MVDDPDIFRAAKLVIDQRGEEAATFAAGRADLLLEEGEVEGLSAKATFGIRGERPTDSWQPSAKVLRLEKSRASEWTARP
jgi:hypothetical protein